MEYFQDDLFPDTTVSWEPALTSDQWFAGENGTQRKLSLRPDGMKACMLGPIYTSHFKICISVALNVIQFLENSLKSLYSVQLQTQVTK